MVRQAMNDDHVDIEDCMAVIEQFCEQAMTQLAELETQHRAKDTRAEARVPTSGATEG